jgi:4-amino-4-deoxy-L-arabinose transferase-like glycosyltransferase
MGCAPGQLVDESMSPSSRRCARAATIGLSAAMGLVALLSVYRGWCDYHLHYLAGCGPLLAMLLLCRRRPALLTATPARWFIGGVMLAAFAMRLAAVLLVPYAPDADFEVYHQAGVAMSRTWELRVHAAGMFRTFMPPGQIFAMGLVYRVFGPHVVAAQMLNVVLATLTVGGIWLLGRRLFGEAAGRAAAVLAAMLPSSVFGCVLLGAEVPEAFWLVAAMCVYVPLVELRPAARARRVLPAALLTGVLLGVGTLVRPTYLLLPGVLGLGMLLAWRRKGLAMASSAAMVIGLAAVVAPWTLRNYVVTGGLIVVSSNAGGVLYSANNPQARGDYTHSAAMELYALHPDDDLAHDREGRRRAIEWIQANPGRFAQLAGIRAVLLWWSDRDVTWWATEQFVPHHRDKDMGDAARRWLQGWTNGFYTIAMAAAGWGLWNWRRRLAAWRAWLWLPAIVAYFTAVHMVFEAQGKYHYMLVGLLMMASALAMVRPPMGDAPDGSPGRPAACAM